MRANIEERIAALEKERTDLKYILQRTGIGKDWRKTFGRSAHDPGFGELIRLGREIRARDQDDDD